MRLLDAALVAAEVHNADAFDGSFARWCRVNGISRATAYRHRERIREQGYWEPLSRRPRASPNATPDRVRQLVLSIRGQLPAHENGAEQIRYRLATLATEQGWAAKGWRVPARSTIHRMLVAAGLVSPEPQKRPRSSFRRFSYARPRDCYQIDATMVILPSLPCPAAVFEVLDDHSRVLVATHVASSENMAGAVQALQAAFDRYGVPALVLSDNGLAVSARFSRSSSTTRFTRLVTDHGARLIHSSPYHPQTCGKVERHHRTFKAWLATQPPPTTLAQLQRLADTYQRWYNTERRHSVHNAPPQHAWDTAPELGGPQHLPVQQDAHVTVRKVSATGAIAVRSRAVTIGLRMAGQTVTTLLDGDHLTVYAADGQPLGHLRLDYTKRHQGRLIAA
jgi:transposase InsO family protein